MSRLWVLGAGQLGAMLKTAGRPLALDVVPVDIDTIDALHLHEGDVVTAEREQWPETLATRQLASHDRFINRDVFGTLADRKTQKALIDSLSLATAPWQTVTTDTRADALHTALGERVLLKRRTGGYDGRGQHWLKAAEPGEIPEGWHDQAIAEQAINFDEEVSLVGARDSRGNCVFYPLTLNLHVNGILMASLAPLQRLQHLQEQAESMLGTLLNELDYVGVMAMECFRVGDQLMINELAPRVHNSGHWTQAGAHMSQFEAHLRAIADLPLAPPMTKGITAMVNLVGTERNNQWLTVPPAELHWYGKSVRPGRKVGHININDSRPAVVRSALMALAPELPENYKAVLDWLAEHLRD
ncbi:5-(carboxyamino)imidazole ribonucleotide synthase [Marinimicrobium alkaliphilum]|uniref:5-(carboxyamino)imidazole ribonucleotide synthase n=1 Tax=Marinimicrobium alkaliphilum TaxID=2202654 RepID=UPI000DBAB7E4|nr:5-(carboxyamino)imidazole ribonucleotide synthase [Marinimicrobium alkaliphilum]